MRVLCVIVHASSLFFGQAQTSPVGQKQPRSINRAIGSAPFQKKNTRNTQTHKSGSPAVSRCPTRECMPITWHYGKLPVNRSDAFHLRGNKPQRNLDRFGFWTGTNQNFLPDNSVQEVIRLGYPRAKIREGGMKGAWFLHSPGSKIFLDIGRTLHATSRAEFVKRYTLPIKLSRSYQFALDYTNLTCVTAQAHGFDTVQFFGRPLEVVMPGRYVYSAAEVVQG